NSIWVAALQTETLSAIVKQGTGGWFQQSAAKRIEDGADKADGVPVLVNYRDIDRVAMRQLLEWPVVVSTDQPDICSMPASATRTLPVTGLAMLRVQDCAPEV